MSSSTSVGFLKFIQSIPSWVHKEETSFFPVPWYFPIAFQWSGEGTVETSCHDVWSPFQVENEKAEFEQEVALAQAENKRVVQSILNEGIFLNINVKFEKKRCDAKDVY